MRILSSDVNKIPSGYHKVKKFRKLDQSRLKTSRSSEVLIDPRVTKLRLLGGPSGRQTTRVRTMNSMPSLCMSASARSSMLAAIMNFLRGRPSWRVANSALR